MQITQWEVRYIELLATALMKILKDELATPVRIETCAATVAKGLSLRTHTSMALPGCFLGAAWCSEAAFHHLCILGYVFDARTGMEAIARLEERHVLWRRGSGAKARRLDRQRDRTPYSAISAGGRAALASAIYAKADAAVLAPRCSRNVAPSTHVKK